MDTPVFGMLNQYFVKKRALANSVAFAGSGVGCIVLPLVLNFAIEHYAARGSMFILAGLWLHGCVIAAVLRPLKSGFILEEVIVEPVEKSIQLQLVTKNADDVSNSESDDTIEENEETNETIQDTKPTKSAASFSDRLLEENPSPTVDSHSVSTETKSLNAVQTALLDYWTFLKNLNMALCILGIALGGFAYFNQLFLFPLYAHELGHSKLDGATLVSITGLSETLSRLLLGSVADRKWIDKTLLVVSCSFICSIIGLIVTLHPHWYVLFTYALLLGVIGGTMIPLAMPIVTLYISPHRISSATGLFLCAMGTAFATGPPVLSKY